jgi:hypothetical protein
MTPRSESPLAANIFAVVAVLQLTRAVLGWPIIVDMASGPLTMPLWPSWIACAVFAGLAWLGFAASRADPY